MHELYQVLGVRSGAAGEEIKAAFRRLAKRLHPDLHPGDADAERRLQDVIRAYETLSDVASRTAYDARLAHQRSLRRWRFRANAMTVAATFALTVSIGLHWRALTEAFLPAREHAARFAGNETHVAMSAEGEGVSTSMKGGSLHAPADGGGTGTGVELATVPHETRASQEAPSPQSPTSVDLVESDDRLDPPNETKLGSVPVVPNKTDNGATIRSAEMTEVRARPAGRAQVVFLCGDEGNDIRRAPPHRRLWCSWPALHGSAVVSSQASPAAWRRAKSSAVRR